jgi:hypothetical protein
VLVERKLTDPRDIERFKVKFSRRRCEHSLFGRHSSKLRSNGRSASSYELSSNLTRIIGAKRWLADLGKLAAH